MNPTSTPWETTAGSSARVHAVSSTAHHGGVIGSGGGTIAGAGTLSAADETMAGAAVSGAPTDSAPRVYVESLNAMIDMQTTRVAALNNRVPSAVLTLA